MAGLLEGKAGLVTGAAGGIGRGIAIELAREGAFVLVSDLESEAERAQETIALCQEVGRRGGVAGVRRDVGRGAGRARRQRRRRRRAGWTSRSTTPASPCTSRSPR